MSTPKKTTTKNSPTEKFIYQVDGTVFLCERCLRNAKDPKTVRPLGYLPFYIPLPPTPEPFELTLAKGKKVMATKWKFKWLRVCMPCAKELIPVLEEKDISP